jgi:hypothetical protein
MKYPLAVYTDKYIPDGAAASISHFVIFIWHKYKIATTSKQPQVSYHA